MLYGITQGEPDMAFLNKKFDKNKKKFNRPQDTKNRPEGDDEDNKKRKFDDKSPVSDEEDDSRRNKFKRPDDEDDDDKKKKPGWQDATKDTDRDEDDVEKDDFDKKRGDRPEDDDDEDDEGEKKGKGKCSCKPQIEINPPLRTQYEAIKTLPPLMREDAIAALAEREVAKMLDALHAKAEEHGINFDILFEVFRRGWFSGRGSDHLSEAESAFNRVNSFLADGLARKLDADLLLEDMGINTPSDDMVCDHDNPTPGEKLKNRLRKKKK
jgi:hypothetical protein